MCFYHVFSRNTGNHTHTQTHTHTDTHRHTDTHTQTMHTHSLPTWLLGETTPVGVLCFHNDSKDDLERAEKGAEWERGKCKKIEIRQSVRS